MQFLFKPIYIRLKKLDSSGLIGIAAIPDINIVN